MIQFKLLLLIIIANGAPIIGQYLLQHRLRYSIDGGIPLFDGRPVLGPTKTFRGVIFSIVFTASFSPVLGLPLKTGLIIAALAMLGDIFSSFIKRRLGYPPSAMALGLDQIPESLFPLLVVFRQYHIAIEDVFFLVLTFIVVELVVSRILFRFHIRNKPY